jgi:signal peptidase II
VATSRLQRRKIEAHLLNRKDFLWKLGYLAIAGGVFLIDQTTKAWAARSLKFEGDWPLISGFLNLAYAQNPGIAFSMLDDHGDSGRWGLSLVALIAATLVLYFFWRTPRTDDRMLGSLALLLAGIAGNLTDRMRLGFVIDYIDVQFGSWHYPTFNVADAAICIGAGLLILDLFLDKKSKARNQRSEIRNQRSESVDQTLESKTH